MGDVVQTVGRAAAGVFTLGLSEVVGGALQKPTANVPAPAMRVAEKINEAQVEEQEKMAERKRRQLIAQQNRNIKTSPLGATLDQGMLGGPTLMGQ